MKKILLFFSAVLVSLAIQATVVTQGINLSTAAAYGTKGTEVNWTPATKTIETINSYSWKGLHTAAALDATGYTELVLVLSAGYETENVNLGVDYTGGTPASHNVTNTAGKNTIRLSLQSTDISDIIIRVTNANSSAVIDTLYLYKVIGKEDEHNLFRGTHVAGTASDWSDSWAKRLDIANSKFSLAHEGDVLSFTYTSNENATCVIRISGTHLEDYSDDNMNIASSQSSAATKSVVLRESDVIALQTNGMYFEGINYTLTDVSLITYEQQFMEEFLLNVGNEAIDWAHQHWVHTTDLPTLAAGDELRVTVTAVTGEYPQVNFRHDDGGNNPVNVEGITSTVPTVYRVVLTAAQATDINNGKLFIVGQNVTLSRFAIAKPRGIYTTLYHGEKAMDWTGLSYEASQFSGLTVGDRICANVSEIGDMANYPKLFFSADYTNFTPAAQYDFSASHAAPMTVSYPVTAEMLSLIQTNGLRLRGEYCTVTEVYVQSAAPTTVSYNLKVSAAGMATLVLPFNVSTLPAGVEAYTLVNNGDATIFANPVSSIEADKPVLILAEQNEDPGYEFVSEQGALDDISGKAGTFRNEALVGTYRRIDPLYGTDGEGGHYHYILNNGSDGVAFYQVLDNNCYVEPYRAYLSCSYPGGGSHAPMRIVFRQQTPTDMEALTAESQQPIAEKVLLDGKLFIIRNGVMYNVNGQIIQ